MLIKMKSEKKSTKEFCTATHILSRNIRANLDTLVSFFQQKPAQPLYADNVFVEKREVSRRNRLLNF